MARLETAGASPRQEQKMRLVLQLKIPLLDVLIAPTVDAAIVHIGAVMVGADVGIQRAPSVRNVRTRERTAVATVPSREKTVNALTREKAAAATLHV